MELQHCSILWIQLSVLLTEETLARTHKIYFEGEQETSPNYTVAAVKRLVALQALNFVSFDEFEGL